jgi:Prokaryotic E2 family A/ThiF family/Prokaryotic homologs of the JAB domain
MVDDLHTSRQVLVDENVLSAPIRAAITELREAFPGQVIQPRHWHASYVAVPLMVAVELPSRGPVGGVDIRPQEPIILLLERDAYPYKAPFVRSDRRDFPKTVLPHINPTGPGQPASLCLHRGPLDVWFAEHTIVDLVNRARGWLRDAARDRLVPEQDGFERTMVAETHGTLLYDPPAYLAEIAKAWNVSGSVGGYSVVAYDLLDNEAKVGIGQKGYTARANTLVPADAYDDHLRLAALLNELSAKPEFKALFQRRMFGLLVWAPEAVRTVEHFGELPEDFGAFAAWAGQRGIPVQAAMDAFLKAQLHLYGGVPITIGVRRPKRVLGTDSDIELINFVVVAGGDHWPVDGVWNPAALVWVSDHRTPLTPAFARHVSSLDRDAEARKLLLLGSGALGSKIAMHLARSGQVKLSAVDTSNLSPHNVVRHALGGESIGKPKAEALKTAITGLYPGVDGLPVTAEATNALDFVVGARRGDLETYANLLDATASPVVLNALCEAQLPVSLRVARTEIADGGRLGIVSIEGPGRNPRLDDLQALLFDAAIDDPRIEHWLRGVRSRREDEVGSGLEEIQIGLSCSSATMRLADEVVSFHAATATRRLRVALNPADPASFGGLLRTYLDEDGCCEAKNAAVGELAVVRARNDPRWEVRLGPGLAEKMDLQLERARPSETGGLLVGLMHRKRRAIYVTRLLNAPRDSKGSPRAFKRGVSDLPAAIRSVEDRTGGILGYVGEWHTHPEGGPDLSPIDEVAVGNLRRILDPVPLPTLVVIVTPDGPHPHLFEPGSPVPQQRPRHVMRSGLSYFLDRLTERLRAGR